MHTAHKCDTFVVIRIRFNIVKIKLHLIFFPILIGSFFQFQTFLFCSSDNGNKSEKNSQRKFISKLQLMWFLFQILFISLLFEVEKWKKMSHQVAINAGSKITRIIIQIYFPTFRSKLKILVHREKDTSKNTITSNFVWKYDFVEFN